MPQLVLTFVCSAMLAFYAQTRADIQRRECADAQPFSIALRTGLDARCTVAAWSGVGLEGSCGSYRWEQVKPASAFALLKQLVDALGSDATADPTTAPNTSAPIVNAPLDAACDAAAIVLSLADSETIGRNAVEWARRKGASREQVAHLKVVADELRGARDAFQRTEMERRGKARHPEATAFPSAAWNALSLDESATANAQNLEGARALLARAGGSATLHTTTELLVLAESDSSALVQDAAALQQFVDAWRERFTRAGLPLTLQGRVPVILVSDRDRWRLLITAAFGGDPQLHRESVTIYEKFRPIVLVAPQGDVQRRRAAACLGVARALLHSSGAATRPSAWVNEGLARTMADVSVPNAAQDKEWRAAGLAWLRNGGSFAPIVGAGYDNEVWSGEAQLARSLSYMLVRWLYESAPDATLRFARKFEEPSPGQPPLDEAARFRSAFGVSLEQRVSDAQRWFRTND